MRNVTGGAEPAPATRGGGRPGVHELVLAGLVVVFLVARYRLIDTININWDEFYFLSVVHAFDRGELASAFQTFHVNMFGWVTGVAGTEVDQILAARRAMFAIGIAATALVWLVAWRVTDRVGAWLAALAMVTFSFLLRHGDAFRADPMVAVCWMAAVAAIVWRPSGRTWLAASAAAFALGLAISVKAVLFAPAIGALLLSTGGAEPSRARRLRRMACYAGVVVIAFTALYLAHSLRLAAPDLGVVQRTASAAPGMWGDAQLIVARRTFLRDWPIWVLAAAGAVVAIHAAVNDRGVLRASALVVLSLLLPLASLLIYRNTYPYFYVTLIPGVSVACALAVARLAGATRRWAIWHPVLVLLVALPLALRGRESLARLRGDGVRPQRELLSAVHRVFPDPVPYIDRGGMVSTFPRFGPFMSTYVLDHYRRAGTPVMPRIVADHQPKMLLANVSGLALDRAWDPASGYRLLREDHEYLQSNFVRHWGSIWVAGKRLVLETTREELFDLPIAGPYTVDADRDVLIDGAPLSAGSVVLLGRGAHRARALGGPTRLTLRYGNRLPVPEATPPGGALFRPL